MAKQDPRRAIGELLETMHRLRGPNGCSWDAVQTPQSLLPYLLEEACEVIEAVEAGDPAAIVDELGDLLLQIVFLAEIFAERGLFDFADVATAINGKLLRRHPHVFATPQTNHANSPEALAQQWEELKQLERAAHPTADQHPLGTLPGTLPALQRAQKLVARARRKGVSVDRRPLNPRANAEADDLLGEQLFTLVRQADAIGVDAESALRRTVRRVLDETRGTPLSLPGEPDPFQQNSNRRNSPCRRKK
jgi:uncharacterized protein YabN with tetrapyrrole methylase and pyrophosphatase domain